jgi:hypothetical protein
VKYDLHKPCNHCPFLREGGIKLRADRIREISDLMLYGNSGGFPCHRTTKYNDEHGDLMEDANSKHCTGALVYAEKQERSTQMMRIAERLGLYNPELVMTEANVDMVWGDVDEWLEGGCSD